MVHRIDRNLVLIAALSAIISFGVVMACHVIWYGDSQTYTDYALELAQGRYNPNAIWRTPGYPILLLLAGFTSTHSLNGIIALQALAAALIPVFGYLTLAPINRTVAAVTGFCLAFSLIPFAFVTTIYPDGWYMLGLVVVTFLATRWLAWNASLVYLYALAAACLSLAWIRPAGFIVALCVIGLLLIRRRPPVMHVVIIALLAFVANDALGHFQAKEGRPATRSMFGRQVFFNSYLSSGGMDLSGRRGRDFQRQVLAFFSQDREIVEEHMTSWGFAAAYDQLLTENPGGPDKIVDALFAHPTKTNFWILFSVPGTRTPEIPDRYYFFTSIEQYKRHLVQMLSVFLADYRALVLGPAWRYEEIPVFEITTFTPTSPERSEVLPADILSPAQFPGHLPWEDKLNAAFEAVYTIVVPASFVLMLIGAVGFLFEPGPARTTSLVIFAIHFCNVLVLALLVDPQYRYQIQDVPLAMVGAGMGLIRLATLPFMRRAVRRAPA